MKTIDYKIDKDGVAILTIDVKDRSMNVMTPEFLQDLSDAVDKVAGDDKVKGAVITSAKDSFMAGAGSMPMSLGRRWVPPPPGISPTVTSGRPRTDFGLFAATR